MKQCLFLRKIVCKNKMQYIRKILRHNACMCNKRNDNAVQKGTNGKPKDRKSEGERRHNAKRNV